MAAGPQFKLLATNSLDESLYVALAVSDGELFIHATRIVKYALAIARSQLA